MKLIPIEGNQHYFALKDGSVMSMDSGKPHKLKPQSDGNGYRMVGIYGKMLKVHRLIAKALIPNPENKPEVNHINGIKADNCVENLEWCTRKENIAHAIEMRLVPQNQIFHTAKFTAEDVRKIRRMLKSGMQGKEIAEIYDVYPATISDIKLGKTWKHLK